MAMDGVLKLYFGESNIPTPDYIKRAALKAMADGFTYYTENAGLPSLPCAGILDIFDEGDIAEVDVVAGTVRNIAQNKTIDGQPLPAALQEIVDGGGVEQMLRATGYLAELAKAGK